MFNKLSNTQKGTLLAFIGVMIVTPDSLIIRLVSIDTWNLLFYRSLFPGTALLIGYFVFFSSRAMQDFISSVKNHHANEYAGLGGPSPTSFGSGRTTFSQDTQDANETMGDGTGLLLWTVMSGLIVSSLLACLLDLC